MTQQKQQTLKKWQKVPLVLMSLIIFLLFVQVWVSNHLANFGKKLADTQEQIEQTHKKNMLLQEKIASASSLMVLKHKAAGLGFNQSIIPKYLDAELPVALDKR